MSDFFANEGTDASGFMADLLDDFDFRGDSGLGNDPSFGGVVKLEGRDEDGLEASEMGLYQEQDACKKKRSQEPPLLLGQPVVHLHHHVHYHVDQPAAMEPFPTDQLELLPMDNPDLDTAFSLDVGAGGANNNSSKHVPSLHNVFGDDDGRLSSPLIDESVIDSADPSIASGSPGPSDGPLYDPSTPPANCTSSLERPSTPLQELSKQGKLGMSIVSDQLPRYWRNDKKELTCFPKCWQYGDFFKAKVNKQAHVGLNGLDGPCRDSVRAELDISPKELSNVAHSEIEKEFVAILKFGSLQSGENYVHKDLDPGQALSLAEIIESKNTYIGKLSVVGNRVCTEFNPRAWTFELPLSKKRRRADVSDLPMNAYVVVLAQRIRLENPTSNMSIFDKDRVLIVDKVQSVPFQLESTKTLIRRLNTLNKQRDAHSKDIQGALAALVQVVPFQTIFVCQMVFENGITVPHLSDKVCWVSTMCEPMWGYTQEEMMGKGMFSMVHPADMDALSQTGSVEGFSVNASVCRRVCKDTLKWVVDHGLFHQETQCLINMEVEFDHKNDTEKLIKMANSYSNRIKKVLDQVDVIMESIKNCVNTSVTYTRLEESELDHVRLLHSTFKSMCNALASSGLLKPQYLLNLLLPHDEVSQLRLQQQLETKSADTQGNELFVESVKLPSTVDTPKQVGMLQELCDTVESLFFAQVSKDGYFLWVSSSVKRLYDYEVDEMVFTNNWHGIHENDVPLLVRRRNFGDCIHATYRRKVKSGEYVWVDAYWLAFKQGAFDILVERVVENGYHYAKQKFRRTMDMVNSIAPILQDYRRQLQWWMERVGVTNEDVTRPNINDAISYVATAVNMEETSLEIDLVEDLIAKMDITNK